MPPKSYDKLLKLLVIGDSGVGKTCLLHRYVDDTFSTSFISTIGIDFKMKTLDLDGRKIKLQIWDTAGQERFHTITASYYRGAKGIMLVYDVTNRKTFDNIMRWIGNINSFAALDVEKIMIANKCDMEDRRVVTHEEVVSLASEHKVDFFETSAKTGQNVNAAFVEFTKTILKKEDSCDSERISGVTLGPRSSEPSEGVISCEKC